MIEKIVEENVWDVLEKTHLPIVVYGMGNGADMVIDKLRRMGLEIAEVFASDKFVRGQFFRGLQVEKYSDICREYDDFFIVMSFAVHDDETIENVRKMASEHPLVAPDVPVADDTIFTREFIEAHDEEFDKAYSLLADDESRKNYVNILNFKVSGKIEYLFSSEKEKSFIYKEIFNVDEDEVFVDLGAYDGDTIREFCNACGGKYKKIYAFEADEKNFKKLCTKTEGMENISLHNLAAWDKKETLVFEKKMGRNSRLSPVGNVQVQADTVDNIADGEVTILKMDIEGSEEKALDGARETIVKYNPKLYICAYHRNSDMFLLPLKIHSMCSDYRFYFYHQRYIPAWESNFYGVI